MDVPRHILMIDTSVFAKSNMGRRNYQRCSDLKVYSQFAILVKIDKFTILLDLDHTKKILWFSSSFLYYELLKYRVGFRPT
jgi:hypothetical protein